MMRRRLTLAALVGVAFLACTVDREDPVFDNPLDPGVGGGLDAPDSVVVEVGDNVVRLSWRAPSADVGAYSVLRETLVGGDEEDERQIATVSATAFTDRGVLNGRVYAYRVAAMIDGRPGARSDRIQAVPGLFTIIIDDDAPATRNRSVSVLVDAAGAEAVQLSEDVDDFSGAWRPSTGTVAWTLSAGDGMKAVHARFRFPDGVVSLPISDQIRLDTRAVIATVSFDGADVRQPGERVHVRVDAGEPSGAASITVDGVFDAVPLFDDGTEGDTVANDGIYERTLTLPAGTFSSEAAVTASFVDEVGNAASPVAADRLLTVQAPPDAVLILEARSASPPDAPSVTLRWERSREERFAALHVHRSESATVDSTDERVGTVTDIATESFSDPDVVEGHTYRYRAYVLNGAGLSTGSNTISATVPNERPPDAPTLATSAEVSTSRISLSWSRVEATDFAAYRLYRNEIGAVSDGDVLVATITDVNVTYWDDGGLRENTDYFYRIYTDDEGGLVGRSAEVMLTTANESPPAVVLNEATDVDSTAATISWSVSDAHDFAFYRLRRDVIPTVSSSSDLVVELDDPTSIAFRDEELEPVTRYYYRVFVVDDAEDEASTGSNTISITTTTRRESS